MRLLIERKPIKVYPDPKRVIARFFFNGEQRAKEVIQRVMSLNDDEVFGIISPLLQEYSKRHRNITKVLNRHCYKLKDLFDELKIDFEEVPPYRKLLLGSYFTHEYSIESAAFFNPSIIEDPDQSELEDGEKRLIISFRAVGEGHISSIAFRRALIDKHNNITVIPAGNYIDEAEVVRNAKYNKKLFFEKAVASKIDINVVKEAEEKLDEHFDYSTLRKIIIDSQQFGHDQCSIVSCISCIIINSSIIFCKFHKPCIFYTLTFEFRDRKNNTIRNICIQRKNDFIIRI